MSFGDRIAGCHDALAASDAAVAPDTSVRLQRSARQIHPDDACAAVAARCVNGGAGC